ncbi:hypothetical protein R9C00_28495 [Flammeovirgaceae bacterium SG7u.111]|nr:hypothetical protein [Flammeovirgaceae bacterium SG7u.132]WPO35641.1 hypothetical protein R9C00_28495 [Flammeovirgaceae bacterium SG7u.111]
MKNNLLRHLLSVALLCLISSTLFAQLFIKNNFELEIAHAGDNYRVLPLSSGNIFLLFQENKGSGANIRSVLLDDRLRLKWEKDTPLGAKGGLIGLTEDLGFGYALFRGTDSQYILLKIDLEKGEVEKSICPNDHDMDISHFEVVNGNVLAGGELDGKAFALKYRPGSGKLPTILFHNLYEKSELRSINVDRKVGVVNFFLTSPMRSAEQVFYFNTFDLKGNSLERYKLDMGTDFRLLTYQVGIVEQDEFVVIGNYGVKKVYEDNSHGVYSAHIGKRMVKATRYYDFGRLKSYFSFLEDKKKERVLRKIAVSRKKKKPFKSPYVLEARPLSYGEQQFIFTASTHKYFPHPARATYTYLSSFSCGFDKKGRLVWDKAIPYKGRAMVTPQPFELTAAGLAEGRVAVLQKLDGVMRYNFTAKKEYDPKIQIALWPSEKRDDIDEYVMAEELVHLFAGKFLRYAICEKVDRKNPAKSRIVFSVSSIEAENNGFTADKKL